MCWRMFVRSCFNLKDEDSHWETVDGQDDKFLAQKNLIKNCVILVSCQCTHVKPNFEAFWNESSQASTNNKKINNYYQKER